jgi:hypothetical protein
MVKAILKKHAHPSKIPKRGMGLAHAWGHGAKRKRKGLLPWQWGSGEGVSRRTLKRALLGLFGLFVTSALVARVTGLHIESHTQVSGTVPLQKNYNW